MQNRADRLEQTGFLTMGPCNNSCKIILMAHCLVIGAGVSFSATSPHCHLFLHHVTSVRGEDHSVTDRFSTHNCDDLMMFLVST